MASTMDIQIARSRFPSLAEGYVYADNAGGSQALVSVADAARDYLLYSNVQLGATYPASQKATARVAHGAEVAAVLFNAASSDEVVFGSSTTQLLANLAKAMAPVLHAEDEIIITTEHEANVGPWKQLATSFTPPLPIHTWFPEVSSNANPYSVSYAGALPGLLSLITSRTRIVALSACSNILGELLDLEAVVKAVRTRKSELAKDESSIWIVVDLVAYAPHRYIDVQEWDVDFAAFSFYKLYGPHTAALYTRRTSLSSLRSIAHHFHSPRYDGLPFKLQPGGPGYELTYAASAVLPYLFFLSDPSGGPGLVHSETLLRNKSVAELRKGLKHTSALFAAHERRLMEPLLEFLTRRSMYERGVRVVGLEGCDKRAPTVSFVVVDGPGRPGMLSREIVESVDEMGTIGIRWGHFYAYSLISSLPNFTTSPSPAVGERNVDDGIVRISLVHYNTVEEVQIIVEALERVLCKSVEV